MSSAMRRAAFGSVAAGAVLAAVSVIAVVHARSGGDSAGTEASVAVLLENNSLLELDRRGRIVRRQRLGPAPTDPLGARYLARSRQGELLVVLTRDTRDQLVYVTPHGRVARRIDLPKGIRYRAIEVGAAKGNIYVAGEVQTREETDFGGPAAAAALTVISQDGKVIATATLRAPRVGGRRADTRDWRVYDIAVEPAERWAFVSYHGPNTDGADSVRVDGARLERCAAQNATAGCIDHVHGSLEADASGLMATSGTPPLLLRLTRDGRLSRAWPSGFERAHLMEFARTENRVFTIESCAKTGGMTEINLGRSSATVLHEEAAFTAPTGLPERAVCGERITAGRDGVIAVMKRGTITGISGVMILSSAGRTIRWLPLSPAPLDVISLS